MRRTLKIFATLVVLLTVTATPFFVLTKAANVCRDVGMKHGPFTLKSDGTDLRLLPEIKSAIQIDKFHISPNGKKAVFLECVLDKNDNCLCDADEYMHKRIVMTEVDGSNRVIVSENDGGFNDYPSWAPDSRSILFMHSTKKEKAESDLYRFDIETKRTRRLTTTKGWMESDSSVGPNQHIVVVRQTVVDGVAQKPNSLFEFRDEANAQMRQIDSSSTNLGSHCCFADPRQSSTGVLVFSKRLESAASSWKIHIREPGKTIQQISFGNADDLWPVWNSTGQKLLWQQWNSRSRTASIVVYDVASSTTKTFAIVGDNVHRTSANRTIIFGRMNWPTWVNLGENEIIFPATYVFRD